jgi:hypothetical protein
MGGSIAMFWFGWYQPKSEKNQQTWRRRSTNGASFDSGSRELKLSAKSARDLGVAKGLHGGWTRTPNHWMRSFPFLQRDSELPLLLLPRVQLILKNMKTSQVCSSRLEAGRIGHTTLWALEQTLEGRFSKTPKGWYHKFGPKGYTFSGASIVHCSYTQILTPAHISSSCWGVISPSYAGSTPWSISHSCNLQGSNLTAKLHHFSRYPSFGIACGWSIFPCFLFSKYPKHCSMKPQTWLAKTVRLLVKPQQVCLEFIGPLSWASVFTPKKRYP